VLFAERPVLQVALLESRLVIGRAGQRGRQPENHVVEVAPAGMHAPAWHPAVAALTTWLREHDLKRARLNVFLSNQLVRWQLLEWQPQLVRPQELEAYARLRFRATFGTAADSWRVVHTEPLPGRALPACAIDELLLAELESLKSIGETSVASVVPYFSAAFDRWRSSVGQKMAWFGVAEPGSLTLGLLHRGVWHGLRSARHTDPSPAGWRSVLPALQAQMQLASGFDFAKEPPTLYLVGCGTDSERSRDPRLVLLAGERGGQSAGYTGIERMAWGV